MPFSAPRGRQVARRLLAYAGCRVLTPGAVEVHRCLSDLGHSLRWALDARIEVIVDVGHDCPRCHADGEALEEALLNLIANALDAVPGGGGLWLRARACELPDARPGVEISVSDSGVGMSAEAMRRAGQPFFTTKADLPLAGLGLAATNGFARASGGVLALQTSPSGGLTAALRLPQTSTLG
jgi:signal transduction histidine kinase